MSNIRQVLAALMIVGLICGIVVNFVPFKSVSGAQSTTVFGVTYGAEGTMDATPWEQNMEGESRAGEQKQSSSQSTSWFDEDADDTDGIDLLRAAGPLLVVTLVFTLLGGLSLFMGKTNAGLGAGGLATVAAILFTTLMSIGINQNWDNEGTWGAGFYLGIAMTSIVGISTILGAISKE